VVVDEYRDEAVGKMSKDERGRQWVSEVTLHPRVVFSGAKRPDSAMVVKMHHEAHEECYIANSVKTDVRIEGSFRVGGHSEAAAAV
jgi:organic hydroperoxide reductase OsmC/OhrA